MSNRTVRCVIACENQHVQGTFLPIKVTCSEEEFDLGQHYEAANAWATRQGYYEVFMVIDEVEMQPATVLQAFDWDNIPTIGVSDATI